MTRKYPLDPLRRVREENVDRKVGALSESLRQVQAARDEAHRMERRKRELESARETTVESEQQRLGRGELTAADLARGAAWIVATDIDFAEQARAVDQARARHAFAEAEAGKRQLDLADAKASAEVVGKHHETWQRARDAESAARDEEDAEQAHQNLSAQRGVR